MTKRSASSSLAASTNLPQAKRARIIEPSMKQKIMKAESCEELWELILLDLQQSLQKIVLFMPQEEKALIRKDLAQRRDGDIYVDFIHTCLETMFHKVEDKYEIEDGFFFNYYSNFVDAANDLLDEVFLSFPSRPEPVHIEDSDADSVASANNDEEEELLSLLDENETNEDSSTPLLNADVAEKLLSASSKHLVVKRKRILIKDVDEAPPTDDEKQNNSDDDNVEERSNSDYDDTDYDPDEEDAGSSDNFSDDSENDSVIVD